MERSSWDHGVIKNEYIVDVETGAMIIPNGSYHPKVRRIAQRIVVDFV